MTLVPSNFSRNDNKEKAKLVNIEPSTSTSASQPSNKSQKRNQNKCQGSRLSHKNGKTSATGGNATEVKKQN